MLSRAVPKRGAVHESNPDIVLDGGGVLPLQSLQIRIERRVTGPRSLV